MGWYTHHGQKIELPTFEGLNIEEAALLAKKNNFELIVDDSVHIVGKSGGEILNQNPISRSYVKKGRKIYITTTKYHADVFKSENLPVLYGKKYTLKKKELESHFNIKVKIRGYLYDPGPADHILEVYYKDKLIVSPKGRNKTVSISKGDVLECMLSKQSGGRIVVPDLRCEMYDAGKFFIESIKLKMAISQKAPDVFELGSAYISSQEPAAGSKVTMGSIVNK